LNKVLAFVGAGGGDEPLFVLKMPRTQSAVKPLEREAAALRALHAAAPVDGVPKLLFEHREGDAMRAVAESPLRGRPLFELLDRRRHPALMRSSAEWLLKLAKVASSPRSEARSPAVDLATEAAAEAAPEDRDLILEAGRLASAADALPVVFEQRDFSPWNVHVGPDGGLVVFDWESAEPAGFPALDLIYLLAYCGFFLDGSLQSGRLRESYRATFEGGAAEESLDRYCRALGIDLAILPALHKLTWLVHLRSALRRDSAAEEADFFLELLREETSLPLRDVKPR
jgi:aminoglycoside phosphotransferase (APT) family kinase protein